MPDLRANDKWPNIDGYIELTDELGHPLGILRIQVKKLSKINAKKKKHSFRDNKFLAYCQESQDWTPILFVGVDIDARKAFWVHIDHGYVDGLAGAKTINFPEDQIIQLDDIRYIKDWERIVEESNTRSVWFEKNKKAFSMMADVITPALGKTDPRFIQIHEFLDETNYLLDYSFPIVKKMFYPKTWKLGMALHKYDIAELIYSLYPIALDRNDVQIKEIDEPLRKALSGEGLEFSMYYGDNPIIKGPRKLAIKRVHSKLKILMEHRALNHTGDKFLAQEYLFAFIDKFYTQLGLVEKDSYSVREIEEAFYEYLPLWMDEAYRFLKENNRNGINKRIARNGFTDIDVLGHFRQGELNEIQTVVAKRRKSSAEKPRVNIDSSSNLSPGTFAQFLNYLKQEGEEKINRQYNKRVYNNSGGSIFKTLTNDEAAHNFRLVLANFKSAYTAVIKNNFGNTQDGISLFKRVSNILAAYQEVADSDYLTRGPQYRLIKLKDNSFSEGDVKIIEYSEAIELERMLISKRKIRYQGKDYTNLQIMNGNADFLFHDTPLLELIYQNLNSDTEEYFNEDLHENDV
jgi:hypothetical protein